MLDRSSSPMGPGAVVVNVLARQSDQSNLHETYVSYDESYPRGLVLSCDWNVFNCVVMWPDGNVETCHFKDVDVLTRQPTA